METNSNTNQELKNEEILRIANEDIDLKNYKQNGGFNKEKLRSKIEPWLTAVFQSEHLSLLCGSGLTIALTGNGGFPNISFTTFKEKIEARSRDEAINFARVVPNFEDYLRVESKRYKYLGTMCSDKFQIKWRRIF